MKRIVTVLCCLIFASSFGQNSFIKLMPSDWDYKYYISGIASEKTNTNLILRRQYYPYGSFFYYTKFTLTRINEEGETLNNKKIIIFSASQLYGVEKFISTSDSGCAILFSMAYNLSYTDSFMVAKFDKNLNFVWAKKIQNNNTDMLICDNPHEKSIMTFVSEFDKLNIIKINYNG